MITIRIRERRIAINTSTNYSVARDASGYAIFATGDIGDAHIRAHEAADNAQFEAGRRELANFLTNHIGVGSEWIHLHFHMALFELECGDWQSAHARFRREILPVATATSDALTDAPGLLWRLALTAPDGFPLEWMPLRNTALKHLGHQDPFVEINNLLALAGAHDAASIEKWIQRNSMLVTSRAGDLVQGFAEGLICYLHGDFESCADAIDQLIANLPRAGGSKTQNQLFYLMRDHCRAKTESHGPKHQEAA